MTVEPIFISPLSGVISPVITLNKVVLAISFSPIRAILSSGLMFKVKFLKFVYHW